MPTFDEASAALQKSCQKVQKGWRFAFFPKVKALDPKMIVGRASVVLKESKEARKTYKVKPVEGIIKKVDGGVLLEVYKGKPAALKKGIKKFTKAPLIKSAQVEQHKKASLKDRMSAAVKGGDKAFKRRSDKLAIVLDEVDSLCKILHGIGVDAAGARQEAGALRARLDDARAIAESDPKDAYGDLAQVKKDTLRFQAALQQRITLAQECRVDAAAARKVIDDYKGRAHGALSVQMAEAIQSLGAALDKAEAQVRADPAAAIVAIAQIRRDAEDLTPPEDSGEAGVMDTVEAKLKGAGKKSYERRLAKVEDAFRAACLLDDQMFTGGIKDSADTKTFKRLNRGLEIARGKSGSPQDGYALLGRIKPEVAAYIKGARKKLQAHGALIKQLGPVGGALAELAVQCASIKGDVDISAEEQAREALVARLVEVEALVKADFKAADAALKKLSGQVAALSEAVANKHREELTKELGDEGSARALMALEAAHKELMLLQEMLEALSNQHFKADVTKQDDAVKAIQVGIRGNSESRATASAALSVTLKDIKALTGEIQTFISEHEALTDTARARAAELQATLAISADMIAVAAKAGVTVVKPQKQHAALLVDLGEARKLAESSPREHLTALDALHKRATELSRGVRKMLDDQLGGGNKKGLKRLGSQARLELRLASKTIKEHRALKISSSDEEREHSRLRDALKAARAVKSSDHTQLTEDLVDIISTARKLNALLQGKLTVFKRIGALKDIPFEALLRSRGPWEEFSKYALTEYSAENISFTSALLQGRFESPEAKKEAYSRYLAPGSSAELNTTKETIRACFPTGALPTRAELDDPDFWLRVRYDGLIADMKTNMSDTFSRYRLKLPKDISAELAAAPLRSSEKILLRWESRLK